MNYYFFKNQKKKLKDPKGKVCLPNTPQRIPNTVNYHTHILFPLLYMICFHLFILNIF